MLSIAFGAGLAGAVDNVEVAHSIQFPLRIRNTLLDALHHPAFLTFSTPALPRLRPKKCRETQKQKIPRKSLRSPIHGQLTRFGTLILYI